MSRIAKNPVSLPKGVEVTFAGKQINIKGPKGAMSLDIHDKVEVTQEEQLIKFAAKSAAGKAMSGTTRALVQNLVTGVTTGFEKKLTLVGVGYRAQVKGKVLNLTLGFSHPVNFDIPEGITIETPSQTEIVVKSMDKQALGQVAANIRAYRPPEVYKGKGIRYADEHIKLKETKK